MKLFPEFLRATAFEYKHRFMVHGFIYALGFAAPWHLPVWSFMRNQSCWFELANAVSKPTFENFAPVWNATCALLLLFAASGAALRVWGAAYLGAETVHRGGMVGTQVIANGPYRYLRNPLYLGTLLNSVALAVMMRPEAALLTMLLLLVVQLRLIGREEPFLLHQRGAAYEAYCEKVPRLLPRLKPAITGSGARPNWRQGLLSEVYMVGTVITFAAVGWTRGFAWDASLLHVMQGIIIALGLSLAARAFTPTPAAQHDPESASR